MDLITEVRFFLVKLMPLQLQVVQAMIQIFVSQTNTSINGGAGNDSIVLYNAPGLGETLVGGGGTDTLASSNAGWGNPCCNTSY